MASYNPNYFRKGLLPLLLLHLLQEKDMYGYELVKTIAARTNGTIADDEAVQLCIVILGPFHHLDSGFFVAVRHILKDMLGYEFDEFVLFHYVFPPFIL